MLIVGYCEHGSLLSLLRARAKQSDPLGLSLKLTLSMDTARGMLHLIQRHFIHRDLAARNVLVGTGMVGQVADFGLSRGTRLAVNDADSDGGVSTNQDGEYYRSQAGVFPIRWTAPEAMETLRFSPASDVWSFGAVSSFFFFFFFSLLLPTSSFWSFGMVSSFFFLFLAPSSSFFLPQFVLFFVAVLLT